MVLANPNNTLLLSHQRCLIKAYCQFSKARCVPWKGTKYTLAKQDVPWQGTSCTLEKHDLYLGKAQSVP
jgi:hypothetical protein